MNTRVVIPCRISFANIWEPKSVNGSEPKYSVSCIVPKNDTQTITKIREAVEAAKELGKAKKWGGEIPRNCKSPIHDGDEDRPNDMNYKDCFYINAISKDAPMVVDRNVQPIIDRMECASGDFCNVSVNFYAFNSGVQKGIAAGLGNIQKVKTGERFGGRVSASADFGVLEDEPFEVPDYMQ